MPTVSPHPIVVLKIIIIKFKKQKTKTKKHVKASIRGRSLREKKSPPFYYVHKGSSMMDVSNALPGPVRHAAQRPESSVRSGNYCCSSIRVASIDENKNGHRKITMTHNQTTYINHIALRAGKKGARPAEVGALASVFEKSATELKKKITKCKKKNNTNSNI